MEGIGHKEELQGREGGRNSLPAEDREAAHREAEEIQAGRALEEREAALKASVRLSLARGPRPAPAGMAHGNRTKETSALPGFEG